jgi:hypothetical protein
MKKIITFFICSLLLASTAIAQSEVNFEGEYYGEGSTSFIIADTDQELFPSTSSKQIWTLTKTGEHYSIRKTTDMAPLPLEIKATEVEEEVIFMATPYFEEATGLHSFSGTYNIAKDSLFLIHRQETQVYDSGNPRTLALIESFKGVNTRGEYYNIRTSFPNISDKLMAKAGEVVTISYPVEGHEIKKIIVMQGETEIGVTSQKQFIMPAGDVDVTVDIRSVADLGKFRLTLPATTNGGKVTANPTGVINAHTPVTLTITPDTGYELDEIAITGETANGSFAIGLNAANQFLMPLSDVTVSAAFKEITPLSDDIEGLYEGTETVIDARGGYSKDASYNLIKEINGTYKIITGRSTLMYENITATKNGMEIILSIPDQNYEINITGKVDTRTNTLYLSSESDPQIENNDWTWSFEGQLSGDYYTVVIPDFAEGTVTANKTRTTAEDLIEISVEPQAGYKVERISFLYKDFNIELNKDNHFLMPAGNVEISVIFSEDNTTVTLQAKTAANASVELFPNPAKTEVNILLPSSEEAEISIFNMQGKILKQTKTRQENTVLNVADLPQGMYLVSIVQNGVKTTKQLMVEK